VYGIDNAFNGLVRTKLVRKGVEEKLQDNQHTYVNVYAEMFLQICMEYPGLPNALELNSAQIRFFYMGLRSTLINRTK
jgi:hypothetical protein